MRTASRLLVPILGVIASLAAVTVAQAGTPAAQLRGHVERVHAGLGEGGPQHVARAPQHRAAIRHLAAEIFDVEEMSRRALGRHWRTLTPDEQAEFARLFSHLLERAYLAKLALYRGIAIVGDTIDGDYATVKSRVPRAQGGAINVEYRLLRRGDRWVTYDVLIENVSLLTNYRTQFDSIIQRAGYPDLVRRLRASREARPAAH
ncbi:MAG: MlaC/ttg2D family ABC transporter substrate-binding protein [Candidatus Rokuibacteriota bacterium]